jgi:hypothetical protein
MTRYAVDETRDELIATWETGYGAVAARVAPLPESIARRHRLAVAAELSGLSEVLWRCYTHPASAAASLDVNTEGWRREQTRAEFAAVVRHIREPNMPHDNGTLIVSYDPVEERAHRVGRCLHAAADPALTSAVIADVEAELAAVEQAELGDLSGRAAQAVQLTREDASPVQVVAADRLLATNPLGADGLFLEFDPTSACVAAAHWLQAAAEVVAEVSGIAVTNVVVEADNIEALPFATPTRVLELMELRLSPTAAVTELIREAMALAEGQVPDVEALRDQIESADEEAERYAQGRPGGGRRVHENPIDHIGSPPTRSGHARGSAVRDPGLLAALPRVRRHIRRPGRGRGHRRGAGRRDRRSVPRRSPRPGRRCPAPSRPRRSLTGIHNRPSRLIVEFSTTPQAHRRSRLVGHGSRRNRCPRRQGRAMARDQRRTDREPHGDRTDGQSDHDAQVVPAPRPC